MRASWIGVAVALVGGCGGSSPRPGADAPPSGVQLCDDWGERGRFVLPGGGSLGDFVMLPDGSSTIVGHQADEIVVIALDPQGQLRTNFGTGGIVRLAGLQPERITAHGQGYLVGAAGKNLVSSTSEEDGFVVALDAQGQLMPTFCGGRWLSGDETSADWVTQLRSAGGGMYVATSTTSDSRIRRFDASCAQDMTYGDAGAVAWDPYGVLRFRDDGASFIAVGGGLADEKYEIRALGPDGSPLLSFGEAGNLALPIPATSPVVLEAAGTGWIVGGEELLDSGAVIFRLGRVDAAGRLDESFGNAGIVELSGGTAKVAVSPASDGGIAILEGRPTREGIERLVTRLDASGQRLSSFGVDGSASIGTLDFVNRVWVLPDGRALVSGGSTSSIEVRCLPAP